MPLVKIAKSEKDALSFVCGLGETPVIFYTIEENDEMLLAEIRCMDSSLFYLGRMMAVRIEQLELLHKTV